MRLYQKELKNYLQSNNLDLDNLNEFHQGIKHQSIEHLEKQMGAHSASELKDKFRQMLKQNIKEVYKAVK